jgi:hypothetical protein
MRSSDSVALEKQIFLIDSTPLMHFCDYLTFEEDLALNLNNLEFHLPKDELYQV